MNRMSLFHLGTISMLSSFALGTTIPVMSLMLLDKGLDLSSLAFVMGAYSLVVIVTEIPSGLASDRFGRKQCFVLAKLFSVIGMALLLRGSQMVSLVMGLVFQALARAFISGSFEALVIDWHVEQKGAGSLHRTTTLLAIWETVGLSAGSLASGAVAMIFTRMFPQSGAYDGNLAANGCVNLLVLVLTFLWVREPKANRTDVKADTGIKPVFRLMRSNGMLIALTATAMISGFFLSAIEKYWQSRFITFGSGPTATSLLGVMAFIGFMGALAGSNISGRVLERHGSSTLVWFALSRLMLAASLFALSLAVRTPSFTIAFGMFYLSVGMSGIPEQVLLNRLTPSSMRASVLSVSSFFLQAGGLVSSVFAGFWMRERTDPIASLWLICAVVTVIGLIPFLIRHRRWKTEADR